MRNYKGKTVEQFLEMLIAERGASSNTCTSYLNDITNFDKFLSGAETTLEDATTDHVRRYLRHRSEVGANNPTISRNLSVLRQFFKFLQSENVRLDNPALNVDGPKVSRTLPKVISEDDVEALLKAAHKLQTAEGIRLTCLLEIAYASGLRVTELVSLPTDALNLTSETLLISGKGGKERLVPIGDQASHHLQLYLPKSRIELLDQSGMRTCSTVFLNRRGKAMTRQAFWYRIKEYANRIDCLLYTSPSPRD